MCGSSHTIQVEREMNDILFACGLVFLVIAIFFLILANSMAKSAKKHDDMFNVDYLDEKEQEHEDE